MSSTQSTQLLEILKERFRAQGLRYSDLADKLSVGERTIKRYLSGHGLSPSILERLCFLAGVRLSEIALELEEREERPGHLSPEQETALSTQAFAAFAFRLLRHGWSIADLQEEFSLQAQQLTDCLGYLQKAKLIDLLPGNRVLIRTKQFIDWSPGGPVRRVFDTAVKQGFHDMDYGDPQSVWDLKVIKVSDDDLGKLRELVREFSDAVKALGSKTRRVHEGGVWFSALAAVRGVDPATLRQSPPEL